MNTNTQNTNDKALTPAQEVRELWTLDQMNLIRQTIAPGISLSELHLFAMICKRTGLDPFTKQIYAIKRGGRMTIQTGIDGYRVLAVRTGELAGIEDAIYDVDDAAHPNRASVTVWRLVQGHRVAFTATARWNEYVQTSGENGKPTSMWAKMPFLMLAKCAESLALRKAFPAELSGIYTAEEMAQADNTVEDAPISTHGDNLTAQHTHVSPSTPDDIAETPAPPQRASTQATPPADTMDTTIASANEQTRLAEKLRKAGYDTLATAQDFLNGVAQHVDALALKQGTSDLTLRELATITQRLTALASNSNGKAARA